MKVAGQEILKLYGAQVLTRGIDLLVSSIGLFTDDDILSQFIEITEKTGAKMSLSAGALPGIDWMSATSFSKVNDISIIQTKPVESWKNTPAETFIDLNAIKTPTCFFEGSAREAMNIFTKSSNITAMLALATIGLDHIKVKLVADPINSIMNTAIHFDSEVGELEINLKGVPSFENPSTSAEVPLSIIKTIRNISSTISYGV
ncbi:aspartate dehydrogenase domain-containing protein [Psychromonas sp. KJ10-10]|uniref:aspartate dehydrogenase domain-containing protein n=1 Tax=Psychromonas sp. KJ10-10 TaxID=3391823 RepID=UPI0039B47DBB